MGASDTRSAEEQCSDVSVFTEVASMVMNKQYQPLLEIKLMPYIACKLSGCNTMFFSFHNDARCHGASRFSGSSDGAVKFPLTFAKRCSP